METLTLEREAQQALLNRRSTLRQKLAQAGPAPEREESLSDLEQRELARIDEALQRIQAGLFGRCASCGGAIGRQRLRAVPEARHCWACSERVGR